MGLAGTPACNWKPIRQKQNLLIGFIRIMLLIDNMYDYPVLKGERHHRSTEDRHERNDLSKQSEASSAVSGQTCAYFTG
jgi:hypothetical protein